jgi:hypothetical protein
MSSGPQQAGTGAVAPARAMPLTHAVTPAHGRLLS